MAEQDRDTITLLTLLRMRQAVRNIRNILSLPDDDSIATVQFGHNSHELVFRSDSSCPQCIGA